MSAHETTAQLESTLGCALGASALALRWVHPSPEGPVTPLEGGRFLLGRGEKCRTQLEGDAVSRYHAEIRFDGDTPRIRDLGSKNGVHVNGAKVEERALAVGDVVRLGACVAVVVPREGEIAAFGEPFPGLYSGPVFGAVLGAARSIAATDLPVVVEGETGTGKERVARAIHGWSGRGGAFVAINCAALPETLAEAELFGYRKGAFTGADRPSQGHFRAAEGGTLLLDEVVDLPLAVQAKVLRAIEAREVVPLGETRPVAVDVRLVAAAQTSLHEAVAQHRFRADLLARLDGATVRLPPLRERLQEVPYLFSRMASRHGEHGPALDPRFVEALCRHDWPYNVREVELLARRMMALHGALPMLRVEHLPERFVAPPGVARGAALAPPVHDARREGRSGPADDARDFAALSAALVECGGNVTRAAELAGISRPRAYRLLRAHDELDLEALRGGKPSG